MTDDLVRLVNKLTAPLRTKVANMVARAVVNLVNDGAKMQLVQLGVLEDEVRDKVERVQNYGFTSVPLAGAEAVVLFVGGRRDHALAVAVDDRRYRKNGLDEGEVAVYHKDGASVLLKADGTIQVTAKSGQNIVLNGGVASVARVGDTAGPYPIVGGNPTVKA